jgi:hypothetical protein
MQRISRPIVARKRRAGGKGIIPGGGGSVVDPRKGHAGHPGGKHRRSKSAPGSEQQEPRPAVRTRAYPLNGNLDEYEVIIRADQDYTGPVHIEAVGDNGGGDTLTLSAAGSNGQQLQVDGGRIDDVKLGVSAPTTLKIKLKARGKYALRAVLP